MERETDGRMPAKRIFRTIEEKRKIVEEALKSPHSVAVVARQHGLNSNQLFGWRKLYLNGQLEPTVTETGSSRTAVPLSKDPQQEPGLTVSSNVMINIEIPGKALVQCGRAGQRRDRSRSTRESARMIPANPADLDRGRYNRHAPCRCSTATNLYSQEPRSS